MGNGLLHMVTIQPNIPKLGHLPKSYVTFLVMGSFFLIQINFTHWLQSFFNSNCPRAKGSGHESLCAQVSPAGEERGKH